MTGLMGCILLVLPLTVFAQWGGAQGGTGGFGGVNTGPGFETNPGYGNPGFGNGNVDFVGPSDEPFTKDPFIGGGNPNFQINGGNGLGGGMGGTGDGRMGGTVPPGTVPAGGVTYSSNGQGGFGFGQNGNGGLGGNGGNGGYGGNGGFGQQGGGNQNTPGFGGTGGTDDDDSNEGSGSGESIATTDSWGSGGGGLGLLKSPTQRATVTVLSCLLAIAVIALIAFFIVKRKRATHGNLENP